MTRGHKRTEPATIIAGTRRVTEGGRTGLTSAALKRGFLDHPYFIMGKSPRRSPTSMIYIWPSPIPFATE